MQLYLRFSILIIGVVNAVLAFGLAFQNSWATNLWAWPDSRLTYIFLGSIAAAIAAPTIWIGLSGELGAATGGALNLLIAFGGSAIYLFHLWIHRSDDRILAVAVVLAIIAFSSLGLLIYCHSIPVQDTRSTPLPVRAAFGVFATVLIAVSLALLRRAAHVFPWPLRADSSVVIGFVFLGAAFYFLLGMMSRYWGEAIGQLLGFLAYDLVLIAPYLRHFGRVLPAYRPSLIIYVSVLLVSGALATYYLCIAPDTRLWGQPGSTSPDTASAETTK